MSTQLTDTIIANQEVIEAIRNNSAYAYEKQVVPNNKSFIDHILNAIGDLLESLIPNVSPKDPENNMLWIVITLGVILVVILLVAHFKFNLFKFARKTKVEKDYEVELEDINTIEFDSSIARALAAGDYRAACRYIYLKTLKALSDSDAIDWKIFKTPLQYTREVRDSEFRTLTNHFLRIRYGDFDATRALFDEMSALHDVIVEKYEATVDPAVSQASDEKGGTEA